MPARASHAKPPSRQASGEATRRTLALVRLGILYGVVCILLVVLGLAGRSVRQADPLITPLLPPADSPATQIPGVGVTVALEQFDSAGQRAALTRLAASGFGWVRQRFDWGQIEPQPGQFAWQNPDLILDHMIRAKLIPIVVLDGSPAWSRTAQDSGAQDNPFAPPADPATFARFAAAFAARYRGQVHFYQVWDEPNIAPHWGNRHIEPVAYAQLLKAAASAIRQADSDAVIVTAALAPTADRGHTAMDEVYFLQRLYAAGAQTAFDAVALQPFGFNTTPADPRADLTVLNFQRMKLVRGVMVAAGDGAKPIWGVRYGWNTQPASPWGTVTPDDQAVFAIQALELAHQTWPWLSTLGWAIDQPAAPKDDPSWGFALTPRLRQTFGDWVAEAKRTPLPTPVPNFAALRFFGLLAGMLIVLWRAWTAARVLPWQHWRAAYQAWPFSAQLGVWAVWLILYQFATWPPLLLLCWGMGALLVAAHPQAGLWITALALPFYFYHKEVHLVDAHWVIAPAYAALLCLTPTLLSRVFSALRTLQQPSLPAWRLDVSPRLFAPADLLAGAWLVINLLASSHVWHWPAYGRGLLEFAVAPLLLYVAVRLLVTRAEQVQRITVALCIGGSLVALTGLLGWLRGSGTTADGVLRLVGPYFSPNHTALYLERSLFVGVGLALATQAKHRQLWLAVTSVILIALALTASRGAWVLGVPVGCGVFVWFGYTRHRTVTDRTAMGTTYPRQWLVSGLSISSIALVSIVALLWGRLSNSATIASRWQIWQNTFALWQDYPWVGVGPGGFFWRYATYLHTASNEPNILHPHNVWLEYAASWGGLGLLWLLLALWLVLRLAQPTHREPAALTFWLRVGLLAGLAAGFAHAQVDAFTALADLAAWNWLALGLLAAIKKPRW